jgi:hypothetical protein
MRQHIFFSFLAIALLSCADSAARVRDHTYPPSFEYIEPSRLHSSMWKLASEVQHLETTLRDPASDPAAQQRAVTEILSRMEEVAGGIATPGRVTQHPLLNQNLLRFRNQIRHAREEAEREPPSYFSATMLAGSCSACHDAAQANAALRF